MKKLTAIIILILVLTINVQATELVDMSTVDLRVASDFLYDSNADISSPESVKNVTASSLIEYVVSVFKDSLLAPLKLFLTVSAVALICQISVSMSTKSGVFGEVFTIICFLCISPNIISSFKAVATYVNAQQAFVLSYVPAFATITASSGNVPAATSYNAILLYVSQIITAVLTFIIKPILACILILACVQAINPNTPNVTSALKRAVTTILGVIMTIFVSIIGIQTTVGVGTTNTALKVGKYLVSSFVPIIGVSLSESYKTVMSSIGIMKSSIGAFGIIITFVILAVPIISMLTYKLCFILCEWLCRLCGASGQAILMKGLADAYSLYITILIIYGLMFIISTGIIIFVGSGGYV